jgi:hypothetical protein
MRLGFTIGLKFGDQSKEVAEFTVHLLEGA